MAWLFSLVHLLAGVSVRWKLYQPRFGLSSFVLGNGFQFSSREMVVRVAVSLKISSVCAFRWLFLLCCNCLVESIILLSANVRCAFEVATAPSKPVPRFSLVPMSKSTRLMSSASSCEITSVSVIPSAVTVAIF